MLHKLIGTGTVLYNEEWEEWWNKVHNDFNNSYKMKQNMPDEPCTMYKTDVKCIENFSQKTSRDDTILDTWVTNIKKDLRDVEYETMNWIKL